MINKYNEQIFEQIKHVNENEQEFWYARELQKVLEYSDWRKVSRPLIRFKLNGKLQYFLIDVPYNKFKDEHHTEIECTAGSSSEVGMTRVFSTAPDQMKEFKEYIFTSKNRVWSTQ